MFDINSIDTQNQSVTATVCENAAVYGATPERGEFDPATSGTATTRWRPSAKRSASSGVSLVLQT